MDFKKLAFLLILSGCSPWKPDFFTDWDKPYATRVEHIVQKNVMSFAVLYGTMISLEHSRNENKFLGRPPIGNKEIILYEKNAFASLDKENKLVYLTTLMCNLDPSIKSNFNRFVTLYFLFIQNYPNLDIYKHMKELDSSSVEDFAYGMNGKYSFFSTYLVWVKHSRNK